MNNKCLIVVDLQNDFCEGGIYPVADSLSIIININEVSNDFTHIIFTKRCYESDNSLFKKKNIMKHCISGTNGCNINFGLLGYKNYVEIKRPYNKSIFHDDPIKKNLHISYKLKEKNIKNIYFCGLDFMAIFNSIIDAYKYGYKCHLLLDCIPLNDEYEYHKKLLFLQNIGVIIIKKIDN
jgi:nicotinamidase/pyrazinamidase